MEEVFFSRNMCVNWICNINDYYRISWEGVCVIIVLGLGGFSISDCGISLFRFVLG